MLVQVCWSKGGTSVSIVLDTLNSDLSNLAETAGSIGKDFCNSSSIIWRCCCTGEELPLGGCVMRAPKYSSNSSSAIKAGVVEGVPGCC